MKVQQRSQEGDSAHMGDKVSEFTWQSLPYSTQKMSIKSCQMEVKICSKLSKED